MKRISLCKTKKLLAVILAASMTMSSGFTALAESGDVYVFASDGADTEEERNLEAEYDSSIEGGLHTECSDSKNDSQDNENATVKVTVDGDVKTTEGSAVRAESISSSNTGTEASTKVTINGDVESISNSTNTVTTGVEAQTRSVGNSSNATTEVEVNGEVKASGNYLYGVDATASAYKSSGSDKATTKVTVKKDVTVTSETGDSTGVRVSSYTHSESDSKSHASVEVRGDVKSTSNSSGSHAIGIDAGSGGESETTVKVDGDVLSTTKLPESSALGVTVGADRESTTIVRIAGNVSATGDSNSEGINIWANDTATSITEISGNVSATGSSSSCGIRANSNGNGTTIVNVGNIEVSSTGENSFGAVVSSSGEKASSTISVDKDITVNANEKNSEANGIFVTTINKNGKVDIDVNKDINIRADKTANGIYLGYLESATVTINVGNDITATSDNGEAYGIVESETGSGNESITVGGNIKSSDTAIQLVASNAGSKNITVDGTIIGEKHNIVIKGKSNNENLNITVWKVDTSDNKNVVETATTDWETGKTQYTRNESAEKSINYIIMADSSKAQITLSGEGKQVGDNYVANQEKKVYFKVDIPSGFTAEFYDVNGNTAYEIIPDGNGGAYISVPRGGGVYVGVKLTQNQNLSPNPTTTQTSTSVTSSGDNVSSSNGSESSDSVDWTVGNDIIGNPGGLFAGSETLQDLQVHSMSFTGSDVTLNVTDVLTLVDKITAINNFAVTGAGTMGTDNVMGSGIVSFNNMFLNSVSDTVDVPVAANVTAGQSYTVMFSDGTSMLIPCAMNGILTIPFNKATEGLTYIIYGLQLNPSMFIGMPLSNDWTV